ncbi:MAG TPA: acetyl-CoA carboxylase biotin carboxylase subunit [Ignavibacteriaceae bacterium]|nr:acetyl-CoA carboxylase biotin carboxylase subunit [Ignavibacteriaceae bacterium]
MFKKILIANRGEIAVRIIRACKELEITSAAVYSEADKTSLHTTLADEAYFIGNSPSSESYLNKDKIIALAKEIQADAIHPGYGYFSENADFIEEVEKSGITFIGPSANSVKMMGSKTAARQLMKKNNVPIVPGTTEPVTSVKEGITIAKGIGYPVLLKASAGGGGKGMRKISSEREFGDAFEATKREALKSFANDDVYIEKFIENPKHIEVQIIGDKHGNYAHLFERECSIQRRHQKIIEEAPSSFVDPETRLKITEAGVNAAKACNYFNAGTIEFLMDSNKEFYFLEMNTRLQVEHPVTELITGIDLVKEQFSVAEGNKLSFRQDDLKIHGHAIESRIYAEDSENNFLPATGHLNEFDIPSGPGVRVDAGFTRGSEISMFYDPLISKLVCWSKNRQSAISRMIRALNEFRISGVINNIPFLLEVYGNKKFIEGNFDIDFIEKEDLVEKFRKDDTHRNKGLDEVAAAFAALMKLQANPFNTNDIQNKSVDQNKWTGLQYE